MPIGRRNNTRKKVILAGIQGLIIGVVGVLLFGLLLNLANDKKAESEETEITKPKDEDKKVEVTGEVEEKSLPFQAKQYGMFTSKESAMAFIGSQPSLAKASIFQVENQFFVWSDLYVTTIPTQEAEVLPTFIKSLYVSTDSCDDPKVIKVMELIQQENLSKKFFESIEKKEDYPDDLMEIVQAISAFSEVPSVMRSHIFSHYVATNNCLKLNF
ncbi:hypothetical protein MKY29_13450 [Psychrobacillus sp. FSL K6-2365]|uniref:hypothetical protein n=1 Tax=Psychrobacillus TaxID=1221880 RepID=UPI0008F40587|nr:hypothetical protein [Psychrobacillus psychrodurans]MCZ8542133.1 hypothetical protein [Psychrobacillus psychrodurans]SFN17543.1 hypothetical protein SAMN05421832_11829 [Psychrobacillus psychrodurans]